MKFKKYNQVFNLIFLPHIVPIHTLKPTSNLFMKESKITNVIYVTNLLANAEALKHTLTVFMKG